MVARPPGPALWRVRRGDAEVVILGGVTPIRHMQAWDRRRVERALEGARELLLPPRAKFGLLDAASFFFRQGALKLPRGQSLEAVLTPELRARYARVRDSFRSDPLRYREWRPAAAGLLMLADFREQGGLSEAKPGSTVARMAKAAHVRVREVGGVRLMDFYDSARRLTRAQDLACFAAALDQIESEAGNAPAAGEAWARGDLAGVRAHYPPPALEPCLAQLPAWESVLERGTAQGVAAIQDALSAGGRSVAVIDLHYLLRPNGVLDRLKAAGDQIDVPPG